MQPTQQNHEVKKTSCFSHCRRFSDVLNNLRRLLLYPRARFFRLCLIPVPLLRLFVFTQKREALAMTVTPKTHVISFLIISRFFSFVEDGEIAKRFSCHYFLGNIVQLIPYLTFGRHLSLFSFVFTFHPVKLFRARTAIKHCLLRNSP